MKNNLILSIDTGNGFEPVAVLPATPIQYASKAIKNDVDAMIKIFHEYFTIESIGGGI